GDTPAPRRIAFRSDRARQARRSRFAVRHRRSDSCRRRQGRRHVPADRRAGRSGLAVSQPAVETRTRADDHDGELHPEGHGLERLDRGQLMRERDREFVDAIRAVEDSALLRAVMRAAAAIDTSIERSTTWKVLRRLRITQIGVVITSACVTYALLLQRLP